MTDDKRMHIAAYELKEMPRADRVKTALYPDDLREVMKIAETVSAVKGIDGEFTVYRDDGEELAVIWWDSETEEWLINMLRGSGA